MQWQHSQTHFVVRENSQLVCPLRIIGCSVESLVYLDGQSCTLDTDFLDPLRFSVSSCVSAFAFLLASCDLRFVFLRFEGCVSAFAFLFAFCVS